MSTRVMTTPATSKNQPKPSKLSGESQDKGERFIHLAYGSGMQKITHRQPTMAYRPICR